MMGRVVLVAVIGIIILSFTKSVAVKPLCFFINKEHTKRICLASEEDVKSIEDGKRVFAELSEAEQGIQSDHSLGIIVENDLVIFTMDYPIPHELSNIEPSMKILKGEYPLNIEGKCHVALSTMD